MTTPATTNTPNPTPSADIDRLRLQNQRLRLALTAVLAAAFGAAAIGFAADIEPRLEDPISITSDGTYLYTLHRNGHIYRTDIETREDANKQRPDLFYTHPINEPNLFLLHRR